MAAWSERATGGDQDVRRSRGLASGRGERRCSSSGSPSWRKSCRDGGLARGLSSLRPIRARGRARGADQTSSPRDDRADGVEALGSGCVMSARRPASMRPRSDQAESQAGGTVVAAAEGHLDTSSRGRGQVPHAGVEPQDAPRERVRRAAAGRCRRRSTSRSARRNEPCGMPRRGHRIGHDREPVGPGRSARRCRASPGARGACPGSCPMVTRSSVEHRCCDRPARDGPSAASR